MNEEITGDKWLGKIQDLRSKHFSNGRDLGKLKYCVEIGAVPSATKTDIRKACKEKARLYHPDKIGNGTSSGEADLMSRRVKEAHDNLLSSDHLNSPDRSRAFDEVLKGIGGKLRTLSKRFMEKQQYGFAEKLLFQVPAVRELDSLVTANSDLETFNQAFVK